MSYDKAAYERLKAYVTKCDAYIHSGHSSGYEIEFYKNEKLNAIKQLNAIGEQLEFDFK